ncbi:hypothetical protein I3843_09G167300 [Carya illinoinensis]|uniref:Uncharacterized protein n=1 Tax=Carya illinoinensis TaxID=32201 RepID=A0A922E521_CARIL|nr:hypothetical protein I3842_09G173100 [Carya illinoinensis]KAG7964383.1 hypothetical protein I3843_09G167300 [Carya illinoinensis]
MQPAVLELCSFFSMPPNSQISLSYSKKFNIVFCTSLFEREPTRFISFICICTCTSPVLSTVFNFSVLMDLKVQV